jgi:molybdopterin synthase catalytic subunit
LGQSQYKTVESRLQKSAQQMIEITHEEIDTTALLRAAESNLAGATVLFLGTTREITDGRQTQSLVYEAYEVMARQKMVELADEARRRWPLTGCAIVHRLGQLELREASVAIAVSSPHRQDAFEAGRWLIDRLKEVVPIWKQENWADGTCEWVHPGQPPSASRPTALDSPPDSTTHATPTTNKS